jgi:thioredoxin 1
MSGLKLGDANFDEIVLRSGQPAVVDFWAPWCGPCRALAPVIDELADEFEGRVTVAKLNTDSDAGVAVRYKVAAIPTLLFFKGGELVDRLVGVQSKAAVTERLEALLLPTGP